MKKSLIPIFLLSGVILTGCGLFGNNELDKSREQDAALKDAIQNSDISKCNELEENYKNTCIKIIEDATQREISAQGDIKGINIESCDDISNESEKINCEKIAILSKAMKEKNISYCSELKDEELIKNCEKDVQGSINLMK